MDHRVSKDMISSGMTPSGEKTQSDLGKTQYGSAPSPNRLMDAYHSMYQNQKEETVDEGMVGDAVKKVKDMGTKVVKDVKFQASNMTDKAGKDQRRAIARKALEDANTKNVNDSVDLLAAYRAVYEHHKKDEDGNTIPHEDDVKEGKIPAGLQAYLDKKKGKKKDDDDDGDDKGKGKKKAKKGKGGKPDFLDLDKDGDKKEPMKKASKEMKEGAGLYANIHAKRKRGGKMRKKGDKGAPSSQDFANAAKTAREDVDLFDVISTKLIEEGYSEKESYEIMSNLTEEELNEFVISGTLAALGALKAGGAALAKGAVSAVKAVKGSQFAANAGKMLSKVQNIAKKPPIKQSVKGPGSSTGSLSKGNLKFSGDQKYNKMKKEIDKKPPQPNMITKAKDSFNKMSPLEKVYTAQGVASLVPSGDNAANTINKTGRRTSVTASADLFDIIKGQLLDEGLSEEEIRNIMLELTPEEIMNEMAVNPKIAAMDAKNKADMIARAKAKQVPQNVRDAAKKQYKSGTPREDPNNPYTTDDKKTIQNYYSKDK